MPTIKIKVPTVSIDNSNIETSNVSSSLSGNMNMIQYQLSLKSQEYINIRNAVRILENFSNWNGYIKLYTETQSNFVVGDICYITYMNYILSGSSYVISIDTGTTYNIENPIIPDEGSNRFYLGYKILYVNSYKNEIVINRYFNDIPTGKLLKTQYMSKITCLGGNFFDNLSDGIVFRNCSILNSGYGNISGIVYSGDNMENVIEGAEIRCAGIKIKTDSNGKYKMNIPTGTNYLKCYKDGYYTITSGVTIGSNEQIINKIKLIEGENRIIISANTTTPCQSDYVYFTSTNSGYTYPASYKWYINGILNGIDNPIFSYTNFFYGDKVTCVVSDDINSSTSNELTINVKEKKFLIYYISPTETENVIVLHNNDIFTISTEVGCYENISYQWKRNGIYVGENRNTIEISPSFVIDNGIIVTDGDVITCVLSNSVVSNEMIINIKNCSRYRLSYNSSCCYDACYSENYTEYFGDTIYFTEATKLLSEDCILFPVLEGFYSDGTHYRYVNGDGTITDGVHECSDTTTCIYTTSDVVPLGMFEMNNENFYEWFDKLQ